MKNKSKKKTLDLVLRYFSGNTDISNNGIPVFHYYPANGLKDLPVCDGKSVMKKTLSHIVRSANRDTFP